ncbi:MAG: ABC transporter ATP-binding protein [Clostridiales bacterium]|nr:ABC transporter ATP-binding protein [Clostridiales bacterium]
MSLYVRQISIPGEIPREEYISRLPVVQHLRQNPLALTSPVTFFVGENGVGKSTLIEALAVSLGFNPEGGTRNFRFSTKASHSSLWEYLRLGKGLRPRDGFFLRAESFYNVATNIDQLDQEPSFGALVIDSYGGVSLHDQSHGESFMALVENRFGGDGLYILDEPEAALSPMRVMRLMCLIHQLTKCRSQFIISTHSPILMALPGAEIWQIAAGGMERVSYRDTEHYQLTKLFFDDPERMIHHLLRQEGEDP